MMYDGYATPRRTLCSSPIGFGVPDTFCGYASLTQGWHPVLVYITPSGFNAGNKTVLQICDVRDNSDAPRCVPTKHRNTKNNEQTL